MKGPEALFESENNLVTEMGAWFPGERVVFRGKDLHHDLADMSWMELYLYGITGRTFSEARIRVFNSIWVFTSYPDPRLWNNRVVGLAASARSTGILGLAAGIAISEASIYGARPEVQAHEFLLKAAAAGGEGIDVEQYVLSALKSRRGLPGFGRPIVRGDERLGPFLRCLSEAGARDGVYVTLAFLIDEILSRNKYPYSLNYAGLTAAVAADFGLTGFEYYLFCSLAFVGGMLPILKERSQTSEGAFIPIRCSDITTDSLLQRRWVEARPVY